MVINLKTQYPLFPSLISHNECIIAGFVPLVTIQACRKVDRLMAVHKAKVDSKRVVAAQLIEVSKARRVLHVSRQRVHQMMLDGKIPYVFVGSTRFPIRSGLKLTVGGFL